MKIFDYNGARNVSGERIRQARVTQRLSQDDLAAKMQVNNVILGREAISKIESGDRIVTDYELMVIAQVLDVGVLWLLGM